MQETSGAIRQPYASPCIVRVRLDFAMEDEDGKEYIESVAGL